MFAPCRKQRRKTQVVGGRRVELTRRRPQCVNRQLSISAISRGTRYLAGLAVLNSSGEIAWASCSIGSFWRNVWLVLVDCAQGSKQLPDAADSTRASPGASNQGQMICGSSLWMLLRANNWRSLIRQRIVVGNLYFLSAPCLHAAVPVPLALALPGLFPCLPPLPTYSLLPGIENGLV